ncbi:MAG: transglutaminase domain-containing protein [Alphaproteobacteria bacterium]|nr:transglutaminase domain-containing protein [Alphaproteobacteria bacterium]
MPGIDFASYAQHSRWSDPGAFGERLDILSCDAAALPEIVGGLVLHPLFALAEAQASAEPALRRIPAIVAALLDKDRRPLDQARAPHKRVLGTCRNYGLLACAILRHHGVPARLRVGFADYFTPDFWEDHWVCEYHDGDDWRLLDPELSGEVRDRFGISFEPDDVPRDRFLTAGLAWQALRQGEHRADRFGVSAFGLSGMWFAAGSLLRDLAALNKEEMMPWDYWGPARELRPGAPLSGEWLDRLDSLAAALACEPRGIDAAAATLARHPWAALTKTILSFPAGAPLEVSLDE